MINDVTWRKARSCGNGACVEVAATPTAVHVRDSKLGDTSPALSFDRHVWEVFVDRIKGGEGGS